jgi:hypothetical protein
MPDYSKGKIYRLTCDNPNLVYYGSTTLKLSDRFYLHKAQKCCSSKKLFEVGGVEIELVLECPCESLLELRQIEQTYIDNDNCINEVNAYLDREEYEKSETRINCRKKSRNTYFQSDKYKETRKTYKQTEKCKEYHREYEKLKYQEYLFTKDIFDEYLS